MKATAAEKKYMARAATFSCLCCGSFPVELHHAKIGSGMARKSSHFDVIPLCPYCHRLGDGKAASGYRIGYHFSPKRFTDRHGTQEELLARFTSMMAFEW